MYIYLNDKVVPEEDAKVSVMDRGFLYGDGIFESLRVYDGEILMFTGHMQRLERSASLVGIKLPKDSNDILEAVQETLDANDLKDATVRVSVSRGVGPRGIDPTVETTPTLVIMAWPFAHYDNALYQKGVGLIIADTRRNNSAALDPAIKSMNFLNNILAKGEASRAGAFDALMLNADGFVAECSISNIFFVKDNVIHTPSLASGILAGVTREHVMVLARGIGYTVKEGSYLPRELYSADEVFLTNTSMEVMPVSRIDETLFKVGPVTRELMDAYKDSV